MAEHEDREIARVQPTDGGASIVDFLEQKRAPERCRHSRFEVDATNRIVSCKDCGREIEPFEALLRIAERTSDFQRRYDAMRKDHRNLAGYVPRLRAVRALEHLWEGKKLPLCPHCKAGVGAEAMAKMGWVHQRFAEAVEKEAAESVHSPAEVVPLRTTPKNAPPTRPAGVPGCREGGGQDG